MLEVGAVQGWQSPSQNLSPSTSSFLSYLLSLPRELNLTLVSMEDNSPSTAMSSNGSHSAFTRSLEGFRRRLSAEDIKNFQLTTIESLQLAVLTFQQEQEQRLTLRNLNKIWPFIGFLQQYARVIEQFVSAKPDFMAFIWVSAPSLPSFSHLHSADVLMRGLLNFVFKCGFSPLAPSMKATDDQQIASQLKEAFDALLDAYARIGDALPIFSAIDGLLASQGHGYVQQILADVYEDILTFHMRAVVFFKQRGKSLVNPNSVC